MPKLKNLSGKDVIKILASLGFSVAAQKGSHVKMKRVIENNFSQSLTIPKHKELDKGTIKAIYNQILKYIPENDLKNHFYS